MKLVRSLAAGLAATLLLSAAVACDKKSGSDDTTKDTKSTEEVTAPDKDATLVATTTEAKKETEKPEASEESKEADKEEETTAEKKDDIDYVTRDELKEFVIVLLPGEDDPEVIQTRAVFQEGLSKALGIPVREFRATDYAATIEAMRGGQAQLANFGPFSYVHARERAKAVPFAVSGIKSTGEHGYNSYIVTRSDSDIETLQDLKGRSFAFVDPESTSGNVVPSDQILLEIGDPELDFDGLHLNGEFFSEVSFSGGHSNSFRAVALGDIDAAAVSSGTYSGEIKEGNVKEEDIRILHESPRLPSNPWCFREDLDPELQEIVKDYFYSYDNPDYWGGNEDRAFLPIDDSAYDYVSSLASKYNLTD